MSRRTEPLQNAKHGVHLGGALYKITNMGSAVVVPSTKSKTWLKKGGARSPQTNPSLGFCRGVSVDIREAKICQNANKKHIKQKEKRGGVPNFTQRIIDFEKNKFPFLAGFAHPFSGIKWHPQDRENPKQV